MSIINHISLLHTRFGTLVIDVVCQYKAHQIHHGYNNNKGIQWNLSKPTPRDQANVSDCTGCRNTQVLF